MPHGRISSVQPCSSVPQQMPALVHRLVTADRRQVILSRPSNPRVDSQLRQNTSISRAFNSRRYALRDLGIVNSSSLERDQVSTDPGNSSRNPGDRRWRAPDLRLPDPIHRHPFFVIDMVVAILSTKVALYLGTTNFVLHTWTWLGTNDLLGRRVRQGHPPRIIGGRLDPDG